MSEKIQDKVAAFDTLFTNNYIQKLKILMPYFDRSMQKNLAVYIKYLELQYTMNFFKHHPSGSLSSIPTEASIDYSKLFGEMMPYCDPSERSQLENMQKMFRTFENYKEMMEMVNMMKDVFPEGDNPLNTMFNSNTSGMGGMDISQIAQMAQMFNGTDMSQMSDLFNLFQTQGGNTENGENE